MPRFFIRRGSLYQGLAIPITVFVMLASLVLVIWISRLYRRDSLQRFEQTVVTNAGFMNEVPLPRSSEMATRLSVILGVGVGFLSTEKNFVGSGETAWPDDLAKLLAPEVGEAAGTIRADGFDIAHAPLADRRDHLVLVRPSESGLQGMGGWVLAPALVLTLACGCLVFVLAHRIVRPLTILTGWLPHLKSDGEPADPVPAAVSDRRDEIGLLARSLEQSYRRLSQEQERRRQSERMATLGHIATRLAHEVRNPAAAIRLHADVLAQSSSGADAKAIDLIREEVDRITDLVNQWLFVARAAPPEKKRHDLSGMVEAVTRRLQPSLQHARVTLAFDSAGETPIECDRMRIEQVVRNLIVNAMQAMPQGGTIRVTVGRSGDQVELAVRDSGSGFSDEALRQFGEPFFSEREGGMGIGLTLAREVIEAHGGTIVPANPDGGGAEVRISLPASPPSDQS